MSIQPSLLNLLGLWRKQIYRLQARPMSVIYLTGAIMVMLTGIVVGLLAGVTMCLAFVEPSHGQFFNNAQQFMVRAFQNTAPGGGGGAQAAAVIPLVMNTLRMLFVMYMLFGIVQVFQAVRQGEEWKDLARTPFFVMLSGTMGDVLVGAIAGP